MRRSAVPVVLGPVVLWAVVLGAGLFGAVVLWAGSLGAVVLGPGLAALPQDGDRPAAAPARHVTPVLSVRRLPALVTQVAGDVRLQRALESVLGDPSVVAARDSTCIVVGDGARAVFSHRPDVPLIPASNQKLLTAVAVLHAVGPEGRLHTEVRAAVEPDGVVAGDLWLVGGGDPLLATADYVARFRRQPQLFTPLEELARRVAAAGVREVRGRVVGDESRYDTERYVPTWKEGYRLANEIGPQSALTVNDGFSAFRPRVVPAARPATHAAEVFTAQLRHHGVSVVGVPGEGVAPPGVPEVAEVASPTMSEVVAQMLRESDNMTAEMLVKELGRGAGGRGSTRAGLDALRTELEELRLPAGAATAADGSGLDRGNRATCDLVHAALRREGPASALAAALPVANRTGTLAERFAGSPAAGRLRAKTGSLDGVAALSGFAEARGRTLSFAMLANGVPQESAGVRLWERVGALLVGYPDAPDERELGPR